MPIEVLWKHRMLFIAPSKLQNVRELGVAEGHEISFAVVPSRGGQLVDDQSQI